MAKGRGSATLSLEICDFGGKITSVSRRRTGTCDTPRFARMARLTSADGWCDRFVWAAWFGSKRPLNWESLTHKGASRRANWPSALSVSIAYVACLKTTSSRRQSESTSATYDGNATVGSVMSGWLGSSGKPWGSTDRGGGRVPDSEGRAATAAGLASEDRMGLTRTSWSASWTACCIRRSKAQ